MHSKRLRKASNYLHLKAIRTFTSRYLRVRSKIQVQAYTRLTHLARHYFWLLIYFNYANYKTKAIESDEPNILIATIGKEIVGFITFEIAEADYFDTNIKRYGEAIELFVSEIHRKKGIGKKLLSEAEEYFKSKGIKWVELQVSSFNANAIDMYKHVGYKNRQSLFFKQI